MKRLILSLALLFLTGCATNHAASEAVKIVWIKAESQKHLAKLCGHGVHGCMWREFGTCYVVAENLGGETLNTLGHEVKHCFDGHWHL